MASVLMDFTPIAVILVRPFSEGFVSVSQTPIPLSEQADTAPSARNAY